MAREISITPKAASVAMLPALSADLARILDATLSATAFGMDAAEEPGAGPWRQPRWLPEALRAEAARVLPPHEYWSAPATVPFIRDWLLLLWGATKHNADHDWEVISKSFPAMLADHPAWCFHPSILPAAGQHFTWFPSVAELAEWMAPRRCHIQNAAWRLRFLSTLPGRTPPATPKPAAPEPWRRTSEEERAKVRETCDALRARPQTPFRSSLSAQGDRPKDFKPIGDVALEEAQARRSAVYARHLEERRRISMAQQAAKAAGRDEFRNWVAVPIDQPLDGDLRAKYGHPCPGFEIPAATPPEPEISRMPEPEEAEAAFEW